MGSFLKTPVRQLSLGQRIKVEIVLSMLHDPQILYLDEPTIGLDVLAKHQIRDFVKERNQLFGVTTVLTSHDMKDLESVCSRLIVITDGSILFDGDMDRFKELYTIESTLEITFSRRKRQELLPKDRLQLVETNKNKVRITYDPIPYRRQKFLKKPIRNMKLPISRCSLRTSRISFAIFTKIHKTED